MKTYAARDRAHFMVRLRCVNLRGEGLSAAKVAAKLGVTKNTVIGHWWRFDNGNGRTIAENQRRPVTRLPRLGSASPPETPARRDTHPPRSDRV